MGCDFASQFAQPQGGIPGRSLLSPIYNCHHGFGWLSSLRRTAPPQPSYQESLARQTPSEEIRSTCSKIANLSTEPVRTVGLTAHHGFQQSQMKLSVTTDDLGPKDMSLLFTNGLSLQHGLISQVLRHGPSPCPHNWRNCPVIGSDA